MITIKIIQASMKLCLGYLCFHLFQYLILSLILSSLRFDTVVFTNAHDTTAAAATTTTTSSRTLSFPSVLSSPPFFKAAKNNNDEKKDFFQSQKTGFYYGISMELLQQQQQQQQPNHSNHYGNFMKKRKHRHNQDETSKSLAAAAAAAQRRRREEFEQIGKQVEIWAQELLSQNNDDDDNDSVGKEEGKNDKQGGQEEETTTATATWERIHCHKGLQHKYNSNGETQQWVKWMKDPRGEYYQQKDGYQYHPCMKLIGTIDAPYPIVCRYLSQESRYKEYNSLLIDQKDMEEITSYSKICWSQSKKLLFIQPRDFVTFCYHRWLRDGTQLILNQACDPPESIPLPPPQQQQQKQQTDAVTKPSFNAATTTTPMASDTTSIINQQYQQHISSSSSTSSTSTTTMTTKSGSGDDSMVHQKYRAYAMRGATYISRHPDYPESKTRIVMLAHANCGHDVPEWAVRTAVKILAPIKPFEIIHRINFGVKKARHVLEQEENEAQSKAAATAAAAAASSSIRKKKRERNRKIHNNNKDGTKSVPKITHRPAGIAQMGYACFWPQGGGLLEE